MYVAVLAHLFVGMLLPWVAAWPVMEFYHRIIETGFWPDTVPVAAREQQIWWLSLFGPTVQSMAIWMGVLVYIGDRQRSAMVWAWLMIGLLLWAPQDILISLRADAWIHVWIDCFAVATMLPPLLVLWWLDRRAANSADEHVQAVV